MAQQQLLSWLTTNDIAYQIHHHVAIRTIEDVQQHVPHFVETMVKTVVFRIKDSHLVLVAARGRDRIDYKKVAAHFGVSRRKLRPLAPTDVVDALGIPPGGVAPIPIFADSVLLIDRAVSTMPYIHTGSGELTTTLEFSPAKLINAGNLAVVDVTKT